MNSRSSCRVFRTRRGRVTWPVEAGVKVTIWGSATVDFVACFFMTVVPPFRNPMISWGRGPPSTFNAQKDNPKGPWSVIRLEELLSDGTWRPDGCEAGAPCRRWLLIRSRWRGFDVGGRWPTKVE